MAQNTFAEIVNNGTFRPRANSKRIREGSDSDFQPPSDIVERAMINWQNVTSTMECLEKKAENMGSDQETAKSLVSKLSPILNLKILKIDFIFLIRMLFLYLVFMTGKYFINIFLKLYIKENIIQ